MECCKKEEGYRKSYLKVVKTERQEEDSWNQLYVMVLVKVMEKNRC